MGGTLGVESIFGSEKHGSRFFFTLPYEPVESIECPLKEPAVLKPPTSVKQVGETKRILVADDSDINRKIVRKMLQKAGHEVLEASDGLEAVSLFQQHRHSIDLILSKNYGRKNVKNAVVHHVTYSAFCFLVIFIQTLSGHNDA
jgi:hypothetical protein